MKAITNKDREKLFGKFNYKPDPLPGNKEHVKILDDWTARNIVLIPNALLGQNVRLHRLVQPHFRTLIAAWQQADLLKYVLTFDGAFAPRFRRGTNPVLSAHAWGSAFDINAKWNGLGCPPAPIGAEGTVLPLVPIAKQLGWFWGGDFTGRKDAMHFEFAGVTTKQN